MVILLSRVRRDWCPHFPPPFPFSFQSVELVLSAMLQNYNCEFSGRDVYRMELIVMQKLDFKLTNHTPYDFLKIVSTLLRVELKTEASLWLLIEALGAPEL